MEACPYLVEPTTDWLSLYPGGAFCRRPDCPIRIPSARTIAARCVDEKFKTCEGYIRAMTPRLR